MIDFLLARQFPLEGEREEKVLLILNDGDLWMATRIGNAVANAPQSPPGRPRTAPQAAEPIAEPKRKRGRPRKKLAVVPGIYPPEVLSAQNAIQADRIAAQEKANEQTPQTFSCPHCGRILPVAVRELHEANCRAAAIGPYTHVAQPGKGGGGSNLE